MPPTTKKVTTKNTEDKAEIGKTALDFWDRYLVQNVVQDFSTVPTYAKLTMLQHVDRKYIKERAISGIKIPYVTHEFAEKALNFAFNFNVDVEVLKTEKRESAKDTEVMLQVKFSFYDKKADRTITRTVFSGHKAYVNKATTFADAYKSALSKAYTIVARTFGIASNVKDGTVKDIKNAYRAKAKVKTPKPEPKKKESVSLVDLENEAYNNVIEAEIVSEPKKETTNQPAKSWEDM